MGVDRDAAGAPAHVAYRAVRENLTELAGDATHLAGTRVPGCPEWTVRDLVAHVVGNCGRTLGLGDVPPDAGLAELLALWAKSGPEVERLNEEAGLDIYRLTMDAFTHELDLREALDVAPPEDHPAYQLAIDVVVGGLSYSILSRKLPALRLVSAEDSWVAGYGRPGATVTASRHDLFRSLTGRRTVAQLAGLDWSEDPTRWLPAFFWGPFKPPAGQV
jgi:uncharacterized protein (TIGR03083 family)